MRIMESSDENVVVEEMSNKKWGEMSFEVRYCKIGGPSGENGRCY